MAFFITTTKDLASNRVFLARRSGTAKAVPLVTVIRGAEPIDRLSTRRNDDLAPK